MPHSAVSIENIQTVTVSFRIPEWQRGKCEAIALSTGRNLSQVMQDAVAGYLDENPHSLLARVEAVERAIAFLSIEPKLSQK